MKAHAPVAALILLSCALLFAATAADVSAQDSSQTGDKHVRIMTPGVEFVDYTTAAEQCKSKKGETIRVKVTSAESVDVRLYIAQPRGKWMPIDFPGQKQGDVVTHYQCDRTPVYKVYARAAGTTGEWAKP